LKAGFRRQFEVHGSGSLDGHSLQHLQNPVHQQAASPHLLQFSGGLANDHPAPTIDLGGAHTRRFPANAQ
jgi:hypothetical protein